LSTPVGANGPSLPVLVPRPRKAVASIGPPDRTELFFTTKPVLPKKRTPPGPKMFTPM
jgi:hypothetical protein